MMKLIDGRLASALSTRRGPVGIGVALAAEAPVSAMTVPEQVQQRARRQEEPEKVRQDVRAVLGDQKEPADQAEPDQCKLQWPAPRPAVLPSLFVHGCLLSGNASGSLLFEV
jgi:hypothetical protein